MGVKSPLKSSVSRQKIGKSVKTIWTYARKLFSVSGVNGVSHISLAKTTGRRILWIILFGFSIIGWFFQTTTLLEYYYKYPTIVKIEVEREKVMEFPAITICNKNIIRKSEYCKEVPERCELNESIKLTEEELFEITFEYMKRGKKLDLGHQIEDMIVSCEFNGSPKLNTESCLEYFSYIYDPHLGNCFVMSSHNRDVLVVTEEDALQDIEGLELVLNVEEDEYLDPVSDIPRLVVTVHEDRTYPQVFAHSTRVYPDHTYNLALEKNSFYLLGQPYKTNCTDYSTLIFTSLSHLEPTPRICTIECLMYHQHKECGHGYVSDNVVLFFDKMPYDPGEVNEEDKNCANRLAETFKDYCTSLCGVPCHDVHFQLIIDSSPTSDHKLEVNQSLIEEYRQRTQNKKKINLIDINVHYQSMEHKMYRHSPEYTTEELFSYLGGITGGWLGISLLEFCAFVEGMLSVLIFSFRYCKPKSRNRKKRGRRTPSRKVVPVCHRDPCGCDCRQDYGSLLLALPEGSDSPRHVRVVPYEFY